MLASYVALIVMFVIHLLLIALSGLNPIQYLKKVFPVLTFAFTSRSSAGAMPLNIEAQKEKLGISEGIANFAASFGVSIGQNGCAGIYPAMLAMMVAPTVGIDPLQPQFILTLIAVVAISSFGVAGVGGGATFAALIVLSTMNLPIGIVALVISVEPLIDMGRTALNVSGSMTAGLISSKWLGELDQDTYNQDDTKLVKLLHNEKDANKTVSVLFSSFHLPLYLLYIRHNILFQTLCTDIKKLHRFSFFNNY